MSSSSLFPNTLLLLTVLVALLPVQTYAFGAGDIPDFAYLNDKAFRHGDIENILETLAKSAGNAAFGAHGGGLLGFASSVIKQATGNSKFSKNDIKKVYFGNWLRDYSQAMDIAGLSKLSADTLVLIVSILGFMTFGYATEEFQVTPDRLGVYLPVEHIDNPKGYAEKEGDARQFHAKLRPPVRKEELEIDERTGMKNYMATENRGWDTSTAFIRRTFKACIESGRRAKGQEGAELWEAYRLLGTGLHTMEDLLAHSNWCEIALRKMGHSEVFCHVGDEVLINTPSGRAPPLVTGTFGSADFLHSLLGEAGDKLSQASVTDLSQKMDTAQQGGKTSNISAVKALLSKIGIGGGGENTSQAEKIEKESKAYNFDPNNVAPPEVQQKLKELLIWHDDVMRSVSRKIAMVPGLTNLLDEISNALNEYIYTVLAPYVGPLLTQATGILDEGSKAVIDNDDQYEVFDNPRASDPSHSLLSKDHFGLILNEPAGKIAQVLVEHSVTLIVQAWYSNDNPDNVINQILEAFHHPYYATGRSQIQNKMFDQMERWFGALGGSEGRQVIQALTKESVRDHKNKRQGYTDVDEPGYHGCGGHGPKKTTQAAIGGVARPSNTGRTDSAQPTQQNTGYGSGGQRRDDDDNKGQAGGFGGQRRDDNISYGSQRPGYGDQRRDDTDRYGSQKPTYGQNRDDDDYGSQKPGYGQSQGGYGGAKKRDDNDTYGAQRRDDSNQYGGQNRRDDNTYGSQRRDDISGYGGNKRDDNSYGSQRRDNTLGGGRKNDDDDEDRPKYGGGKKKNDSDDGKPKYGRKNDSDDEKPKYGGGRRKNDSDDEKPKYGGRRDDDKPKYGGPRKDDDDDKPKYGGGRRESGNTYGGSSGGYSGGSIPGGYSGGSIPGGYSGGSVSGGYSGGAIAGGYTASYEPSQGQSNTSGYAPSYGQSNTSGHGGSSYGQSQTSYGFEGRKSKKDNDSDDDDKKQGRKKKNDSDDEKRRRKGKNDDGSDEERRRRAQNTGYAPSYGGRANETYGVERMNIGGRNRDDDSDDDKRNRRGGRY